MAANTLAQAAADFDSLSKLDPARASLAAMISEAISTLAPQTEPPTPLNVAAYFERPPELAMGDYALPCFRFAKQLKMPPPQIAQALKDYLLNQSKAQQENSWIHNIEIVGAFLNIFINQEKLASFLLPQLLNGTWFSLKKLARQQNPLPKVMIEYSQPNTHKEFHVGHLRNVCLGNSLVRLYRYCNYPVVSANYFGDDGTHIASCLWHIKKTGSQPPAEHRGEWLGQMYAASKAALANASDTERETFQKEISDIHRAIEQKDPEIFSFWKETRDWSLDEFNRIYDWLDVHFDQIFFESQFTDQSQEIVEEYLKKGIFVVDDGAVGVDLKPYKLGFAILRKRDGNTLYATKDLALAREKFEKFNIDKSIVVVGDEQNYHFKQVFKTLELMGFPQARDCHHLSYGMVMLPDGKMSSRAGTSVTFESLRTSMESELASFLTKYEGEWTQKEIDDTRHRLCDGALKFGMLATDPKSEIIFNLKDWLSFEGYSGPYLMYCYTRAQSVLRKAAANKLSSSEPVDSAELGQVPSEDSEDIVNLAYHLTHDSEKHLLQFLYDFNEVTLTACEQYKPSTLAHYLFDMCKAFNRFYAEVPVLKASTSEQQLIRLTLVKCFAMTLHTGLSLLGIRPPERM